MVVWRKSLFFCPLQFVYIRTMVYIVYAECNSRVFLSKKIVEGEIYNRKFYLKTLLQIS